MPKEIPNKKELFAKYKELGNDKKKLVTYLYDTGLTKSQIIRAIDSNRLYVDKIIVEHNAYIAAQYNPIPPKKERDAKLKELGSVANLCRWLYDLGCSDKGIYKAIGYSPMQIKLTVNRPLTIKGKIKVTEDIEELRKTYKKDPDLTRYLFKQGYGSRAIHNATGITMHNISTTIARYKKIGDPGGHKGMCLGTKQVVPELVTDYVYARYKERADRIRHLHILDYTNKAIAEALDLEATEVAPYVSRFKSGQGDPELTRSPSLPIVLGDMQFIGSPLAG